MKRIDVAYYVIYIYQFVIDLIYSRQYSPNFVEPKLKSALEAVK